MLCVANASKTTHGKKKARRVFEELLDEDGDGRIDKEEFQNAVDTLQLALTDESVREMFEDADEDDNGTIDFDEFWGALGSSSADWTLFDEAAASWIGKEFAAIHETAERVLAPIHTAFNPQSRVKTASLGSRALAQFAGAAVWGAIIFGVFMVAGSSLKPIVTAVMGGDSGSKPMPVKGFLGEYLGSCSEMDEADCNIMRDHERCEWSSDSQSCIPFPCSSIKPGSSKFDETSFSDSPSERCGRVRWCKWNRFTKVCYDPSEVSAASAAGGAVLTTLAFGCIALVGLGLFGIHLMSQGTDLGKLIVGLQLVDAETGEPVGFGLSLMKVCATWGISIVSGMVIPGVGAGLHWLLIIGSAYQDPEGLNRTIYDRVLGTRVVYKAKA